MTRRAPRRIGELLADATGRLAPAGTRAEVQSCWDAVAGERLAARARPVAARDGELLLACEDAVWAAELDLLGPTLVDALNAALGRPELTRIRVRADGARTSRTRP